MSKALLSFLILISSLVSYQHKGNFLNFLFGRKKGKCLWKWLDLTRLVAGVLGHRRGLVLGCVCSYALHGRRTRTGNSLCPFSLLTPPCSVGWLLLSQCPSLGTAWLVYQVFLHPVFLLETLFTKASPCFLSGFPFSVFWRQTTFLFLLESSLLFPA